MSSYVETERKSASMCNSDYWVSGRRAVNVDKGKLDNRHQDIDTRNKF
jgi:hypothetical protein